MTSGPREEPAPGKTASTATYDPLCDAASCQQGQCVGVPDPSMEGTGCQGSQGNGVCQAGQCNPSVAWCFVLGAMSFEVEFANGHSFDTTSCACDGNTLNYGTGTVACGTCNPTGEEGGPGPPATLLPRGRGDLEELDSLPKRFVVHLSGFK